MPLDFLTPKFSLYAIGGLGLLLLATITTEELRLWDLRSEYKLERQLHDTCKADLTTSRNNEAVLQSGITSQNGKITALQAQLALNATKAEANAKDALKRGEKRKEEASRLGSGPDVMNKWFEETFR